MKTAQLPDGRTIYRITSKKQTDTCRGCIGDPQVSQMCKTLPPCGFSRQVWVDQDGYIKWLTEERLI